MTFCHDCARPIGASAVYPGIWLCSDCEAVAKAAVVVKAPADESTTK